MKNRSSVEKAEWIDKREGFYKKECFKMEFSYGDKFVIENQTAYILKGTEKIVISKPLREKSFWLETWTGLKKYYNI